MAYAIFFLAPMVMEEAPFDVRMDVTLPTREISATWVPGAEILEGNVTEDVTATLLPDGTKEYHFSRTSSGGGVEYNLSQIPSETTLTATITSG